MSAFGRWLSRHSLFTTFVFCLFAAIAGWNLAPVINALICRGAS